VTKIPIETALSDFEFRLTETCDLSGVDSFLCRPLDWKVPLRRRGGEGIAGRGSRRAPQRAERTPRRWFLFRANVHGFGIVGGFRPIPGGSWSGPKNNPGLPLKPQLLLWCKVRYNRIVVPEVPRGYYIHVKSQLQGITSLGFIKWYVRFHCLRTIDPSVAPPALAGLTALW